MSDILFTQTLQRKAKEYGLAKAEYLCYAAMRAAGIGINDAWNMAFQNTGQTWDKSRLKAEQQKLEGLDGVQKFIADIKKVNGGGNIEGKDFIRPSESKSTHKGFVKGMD